MDYKEAGVDIDKGDSLIPEYKRIAEKTKIPGVLGSVGGFSSLFSIKELGLKDPVLVSGTDGVGTKLLLAVETGIHNTVGIDLVAMSVNDIITCGAKPLFFLDYFASGMLEPEIARGVVAGIGTGCEQAGCALVGGETAELPGMYPKGEYDLAGFAVGVVEREKIIDGSAISEGDAVIGIASSGVHSNGFSLVRHIIKQKNLSLQEEYGLGKTLAEALLAPTVLYAKPLVELLEQIPIRGVSHITGGGLPGNACRMLPKEINLDIELNSWPRPKLFSLLQKEGDVPEIEMQRTFNIGLGLVLVVADEHKQQVLDVFNKYNMDAFLIGTTGKGNGKVVLS